ncbi:hypothetical protein [Fodinibius saliphilus]|uniref:hypothetical protein n=1 Tax=Fodinibius saliphilus TaxID=1920650 RepID=UPI00110905AF|nr:hypothetical protein [Fodinibius saliphilus]
MGRNTNLSQEEAFKLITPVIDGEATEDERAALLNYISHNQDIQQEYYLMKEIKAVVKSRYPRAKAPSSIKNFVKNISEYSKEREAPIYDLPTSEPASHSKVGTKNNTKPSPSGKNIFIQSAAAIVIFVLIGWTYMNFHETVPQNERSHNVEQAAYNHFIRHNGQWVQPTIATSDLGAAELQLVSNYDMPMVIPSLQNTRFEGVVYETFVPDFKTPMLEYYLPEEDQYIYIFAFKLAELNKNGTLTRSKEAIQQCDTPTDFYIRNINGKHVVSWKWNDVWYAAISNHDGNTLASLVEPLRQDPSQ